MLLCRYKLLFLQAASLPCTPAWWSEEDGSWQGGECQRHQLRGWFHDVGELESCEHLYGGDNLGQLNMRLFKLSLTDRQYWPVISERKRLSSTYGGWEWNNHKSWRSEEHVTMFPCVVFSTSVGRQQCEFKVIRANLGHSGQQSWRSFLLHNKDKSISSCRWFVLCSINTAAGPHCVQTAAKVAFPRKVAPWCNHHHLGLTPLFVQPLLTSRELTVQANVNYLGNIND